MGGHWTLDARLTHIGSEGYIDRGATDLKSYMFQAGYYNGSTMLKLISFGGKAKTGLTHTGATKEEMRLNGRRFHTEGMYYTSNGPHSYYYMKDGERQRATVDYYDDQTDNYLQINNQLVLSPPFQREVDPQRHGILHLWLRLLQAVQGRTHALRIPQYPDRRRCRKGRPTSSARRSCATTSEVWNASAAYFGAEARPRLRRFVQLLLLPPLGRARLRTDWKAARSAAAGTTTTWTSTTPTSSLAPTGPWPKGLRLFADLQYRYVSYQAWGRQRQTLTFRGGRDAAHRRDKQYHFFNPRAGVSYTLAERNNSTSFAVAQKGTHAQRLHRPLQVRGRRHLPLVGKALRLGAGLPVQAPRLRWG